MTKWPIISRQLPVTAEIALAKSWINSCITDHPLCLAPPLTLLPTRVLDLESPTSPSQLCLVLGQGSTASYVALSHCWGGSQPLKLTLSTLEEFQMNISLSTLPKTFLDAVSVTRSLGFRYLWIDSLCIIQDSKADWDSECAKMIDVYKNAAVTLAGPAATGCNSGFLHKRNEQIHEIVDICAMELTQRWFFHSRGLVNTATISSQNTSHLGQQELGYYKRGFFHVESFILVVRRCILSALPMLDFSLATIQLLGIIRRLTELLNSRLRSSRTIRSAFSIGHQ